MLLASSLLAQGTVSSPSSYESKEGTSYAWLMGAYPGTRSQVIDGNNKGKALTITQIDMRLDWRTHSTSITRARTWTNVTLMAAASDYNNASSTWTRNHLSTPTTLFSNRVNWPDAPARPRNSPNPWGNAQANDSKLQWVFKGPYVHTGKSDTVWDWTFLGGTLDNNAAWGTGNKSYYLDGLTARTSNGSVNASGNMTGRIPNLSKRHLQLQLGDSQQESTIKTSNGRVDIYLAEHDEG